MKDKYGRDLDRRREFDFRKPPGGPNKRAIRLIIILLFMIAVMIMVLPGRDAGRAPEEGSGITAVGGARQSDGNI